MYMGTKTVDDGFSEQERHTIKQIIAIAKVVRDNTQESEFHIVFVTIMKVMYPGISLDL